MAEVGGVCTGARDLRQLPPPSSPRNRPPSSPWICTGLRAGSGPRKPIGNGKVYPEVRESTCPYLSQAREEGHPSFLPAVAVILQTLTNYNPRASSVRSQWVVGVTDGGALQALREGRSASTAMPAPHLAVGPHPQPSPSRPPKLQPAGGAPRAACHGHPA